MTDTCSSCMYFQPPDEHFPTEVSRMVGPGVCALWSNSYRHPQSHACCSYKDATSKAPIDADGGSN